MQCQAETNNNVLGSSNFVINGVFNTGNVSCYAISVMQCLLHCDLIREILFKLKAGHALKIFMNQYIQNNNISIYNVRNFVHQVFAGPNEQDASEFLLQLCNKVDNIDRILQRHIRIKRQCRSCNYNINDDNDVDNVLYLALPPNRNVTFNLQDIIDYNAANWMNSEASCTNCETGTFLEKLEVLRTSNILIIVLKLFGYKDNQTFKIKDLKIKSIPNAVVKLHNENFKTLSAIFHHGDDWDGGHYTAMLRSEESKWIKTDDLEVNKSNWPKNAKDMYILFLEKISSNKKKIPK